MGSVEEKPGRVVVLIGAWGGRMRGHNRVKVLHERYRIVGKQRTKARSVFEVNNLGTNVLEDSSEVCQIADYLSGSKRNAMPDRIQLPPD